MKPGPRGVPRADILALIREGHTNKYIARTLGACRHRIGRIRAEEGLPAAARRQGLTVEQKWATYAKPAARGHMRWTGAMRGCTPNLVHQHVNYSARRIAFQIGHGREPLGRVLPGCGAPWCIAPDHATDEPMRRADAKYQAIFGSAA